MDRIIRCVTPTIAPLPKRTRAAAYARVSLGKETMIHSLAAQVSYYRDLIHRRPDWEYAGVFADEALTGTKDNRPEFQRLLASCRAGKVDLIVTKSVSRFARNTVTLLETVRELKTLGIGVLFEEQGIGTLSADGELLLAILAGYAQEESLSASENRKWRNRKNYAEGKHSGNIRMYGYDYKDGKLVVNTKEAEVLRMIFTDYLGGMGKNAIVKKLIQLGVPGKSGSQWTECTVGELLSNEKVIGDMCLQKKYIVDHITKLQKRNKGELPKYYVAQSHEAVIDRATFEAVQAERARRAERADHFGARKVSEFTGMIRCGRCGAKFRRQVNASGTQYAKVTWACPTYAFRGKDVCGAKRIPEDILKRKCAGVLGLTEYSAKIFMAKVAAINVPDDGVLVFTCRNGTERTVTWEHRSRSDSWTDEMKAEAKKRARGGRTDA